MKVAILNMGGANLSSIRNAVVRLGAQAYITNTWEEIDEADRLIFPGVGHAGIAMKELQNSGLIDHIFQTNKKILGICLGMQILYDFLEEGQVKGLGILPGKVNLISPQTNFRVPNTGWSQIVQSMGKKSKLLEGISPDAYFYFTHSYCCPDGEEVCAVSKDVVPVNSVIENKNFFATQFHPEKSGLAGSQLLSNFIFN